MLDIYSFFQGVIATLQFDPARLLEPEIAGRLVLQVFLLAASAFFSSSETSLFSLSQLDLQKLRRERHPRANTLYRLLEQPRRLIISILCGNEMINVAASANMAAILFALYGSGNAEWINILIMVPLLLLVGEITPKTIALSNPVSYSTRIVAAPLMVWVQLIAPVRIAVRFVADRVSTWLVGEEKQPENLLRVDEFKTLVEEAEQEGGISVTERTLVYNLLAAGSTEIVEIMIPRTQTLFINADWSLDQIVEHIRQYRHNRLPVFRGHHDNIIGFIHAEDLVHFALGEKDVESLSLQALLHPTIGAPPTKKVDEMFEFFQNNQAQAAVVINEFGGVDGLITMKTVLNFIFGHLLGPVAGQHLYEERDENRYLVPGDMKLSDFNKLTHFGIEDPRMTTVGGVLFRQLDRLPAVDDSVQIDDIRMRVVALNGHRITQVEVARGIQPETIAEEETV
ncbi:MAG: hemolysin family protein [Gammaproteobacteria bacterium]|nr:hemolysin family protein [Gammaproteobacteria bacterium]